MEKKILFSGVKDGDTFEVGGIEFIKFPEKDGVVPAVAKDVLFTSRFGKTNNLKESPVLKKLTDEVLPKIIEAVGEENLCTFKTDLTSWDGLKTYGELESMISLPTMGFYRENVKIFDRYKANRWWWLATPDSTAEHGNSSWILCVSPRGLIGGDICGRGGGVRPFCIFKSSIFGSFEE